MAESVWTIVNTLATVVIAGVGTVLGTFITLMEWWETKRQRLRDLERQQERDDRQIREQQERADRQARERQEREDRKAREQDERDDRQRREQDEREDRLRREKGEREELRQHEREVREERRQHEREVREERRQQEKELRDLQEKKERLQKACELICIKEVTLLFVPRPNVVGIDSWDRWYAGTKKSVWPMFKEKWEKENPGLVFDQFNPDADFVTRRLEARRTMVEFIEALREVALTFTELKADVCWNDIWSGRYDYKTRSIRLIVGDFNWIPIIGAALRKWNFLIMQTGEILCEKR
jgi:hypothetical protein